MEHLDHMDMLREGIGLRAYGQRNPLVEYKIEGHNMFDQMIADIQTDIAKYMYRVNIIGASEPAPEPENRLNEAVASHGDEADMATVHKDEKQNNKSAKNKKKKK